MSFLYWIGQATHDLHNEGILFSDAIGVSTLVCLLDNGEVGAQPRMRRPCLAGSGD